MPPFDAVLLLQEYGDQALVRDLAQLVIETMPAQITALETAVAARDSAAIRAAAHKLRGSITPFRVPNAVDAARKLEEMGAAADLNGVDVLSRELVAGVQSLRDSAKAWLDASAAPS
jgi:HPt (histidine-containing phosphotransfer) domain-containing protein